ncbi:TPR-like protein [Calocera viscosa TUFC12733]|uniref:TPR-like protein n=1 Tax=Calocera viscosa (strain TUFC12733) TaxID=1330018 RepID=A0A167GD10_CALVF|nr:TPR-like protein [Calocera viscosa TUFC12733]
MHMQSLAEALENIMNVRADLAVMKDDIALAHSVRESVRRLPYATGASWNPTHGCLPGTRSNLLQQVKDWIAPASVDSTGSAQIMWLCDVAGSGKTAIAHSVCSQADQDGLLVSSFFFDRMDAERNNSKKLFSTIARDLASIDADIMVALGSVLETDASLATASPVRQFQQLIIRPSLVRLYPRARPVAIVLDGLDEGCDEETLSVLSQLIPRLPGTFRFFITSRPQPEINDAFDGLSHVAKRNIGLQNIANQSDISAYLQQRLTELAQKRRKGAGWPGSPAQTSMAAKSEGLFLWARVVTNFLLGAANPERQLQIVISAAGSSSVKEKMEQIYAAVLETGPWDEDEDFVQGYHLYMGALIAGKEPLSCAILNDLYGSDICQAQTIFGILGALLTGWERIYEPVRLIHLSLRDYLTSQPPTRYSLSETDHSRQLALQCVKALNYGLTQQNATQSVSPPVQDIQTSTSAPLPPVMVYACGFWSLHLADVDKPSSELVQCLRTLFSTHMLLWATMAVSLRRYRSLQVVRTWLKNQENKDDLWRVLHTKPLAARLRGLSCQLAETGRSEEALVTAEDSVEIFRELVMFHMNFDEDGTSVPSSTIGPRNAMRGNNNMGHLSPTSDLVKSLLALCRRSASLRRWDEAMSAIKEANELTHHLGQEGNELNNEIALASQDLSQHLTQMGRWKEALKTIQQAVSIRRQAAKHGVAYKVELADSLHNLSLRLSDMGQRIPELTSIDEVVQIHRELVETQSQAYKPSLASSLIDLSNSLEKVGRRAEALAAIEESVQLIRETSPDVYGVLNVTMARGLANLSLRLAGVGRRHEALEAIEETVALYRKHTRSRSGLFQADFAVCLNNLSNRLVDIGKWEEALAAMEEAVKIRRTLAEEDPTVHAAHLAESLSNLSSQLADVGRGPEALALVEEAVRWDRKLAKERPAVFRPVLAMALHNFALRLSDAGRYQEALEPMEEAVRLHRISVEDMPDKFKPDLAHSLHCFADPMARAGFRPQAIEDLKEASAIFAQLFDEEPMMWLSPYQKSLQQLSLQLFQSGRKEEGKAAQKIAREVGRRRTASSQRPS